MKISKVGNHPRDLGGRDTKNRHVIVAHQEIEEGRERRRKRPLGTRKIFMPNHLKQKMAKKRG